MTLTEEQEQIIGDAVQDAFLDCPVKPPEEVITELAASIKDYLVDHL